MRRLSQAQPLSGWSASDLPGLPALQVVEVLSRHATMRAAGEELGVTHAAVSTTLSRLEARLGVPLFDRGTGVLRPTEACQGLIEAFKTSRAALARAVRAIGSERPAPLTLSLPRTAAGVWLQGDLEGLRAAAPGLALRTHGDADVPDFGEVDAAVVAGGLCPPPLCDGDVLFDERLIPVCTQPYAYAHRLATPAAIARATLLLHSRADWRRWFEEAGLVADVDLKGVETADPSLALQLAAAGQGACLACAAMSRPAIDAGDLIAPVPVSIETGRRFWFVWPRGRRPSDDVLRLQDWLVARLALTPARGAHSPQLRAAARSLEAV